MTAELDIETAEVIIVVGFSVKIFAAVRQG